MIAQCLLPVRVRNALAACLLATVCGCAALMPSNEPPPTFFSLDRPPSVAARRVLATREFEAYADAPSEDPYGGVQAVNRVVASVLDDLAAFCAGVKPSR